MNKSFILFTTAVSILAWCGGDGAKILAVFPMPSPSHQILASALLKELASRGHEVTMVSPSPMKNPPSNYRDVVLKDIQVFKETNMKVISDPDLGFWRKLKMFYSVATESGRIILGDENMQSFLQEEREFDLCIQMVGFAEGLLPISHRFNATTIGLSVIGGMPAINYHAGLPTPYAIVPSILLPYTEDMVFHQRLFNTIVSLLLDLVTYTILLPMQRSLAVEFFPEAPSIDQLLQEVDLYLINSHFATESPRAYLPNTIQIGGFHLQEKQSLPADLKQFLDLSKRGVILFSLGTNVRSADLPQEKLEAIMLAFANSPFDVLWKFEAQPDQLLKQPPNVKISQWLPQKAVLAHPNTKAFITHGGLGSTVEAVYNGVPMICIPFFGDQTKNTVDSVAKGYAIRLDLTDVNEANLTRAIAEITQNPSYVEQARLRSDVFRHQEMNPMDKAVFWVEHVIRHRGAKHMRPKSAQMPWYQLMLIDVFLFLAFVATICVAALLYVFKKIIAKCFRSKNRLSTNKKDN